MAIEIWDRERFEREIADLGLTPGDVCALTGHSARQVRNWGKTWPVPRPVRLILRLVRERGGVEGLIDGYRK